MSSRSRWIAAVAVAFAAALVTALIAGSSDDERLTTSSGAPVAQETSTTPASPDPPSTLPAKPKSPTREAEEQAAGPKAGDQPTQEGPSGPAPSTDPEQEASEAVDLLLGALNSRDGKAVCASFAPDALDGIKLPENRPSCGASVAASLGYRDPQGIPVWKSSKPTGDISAQVDGDAARVTATIVTAYEGQREPSIEDDVLYLKRSDNRWLLVKPSATFYRAIGVADVPLDAFKPPGG